MYMTDGVSRQYRRAVLFGELGSVPVVHGGGTATDPITHATADKNFIAYWTKSTATSGTSRGSYLRHYLAGAGGDGEAVRIFGTVSDVAAANAHGSHTGLSFGTTGSVVGLGVAARATLQIPNSAMTAGTYAASMAEISCDGSSSDPSGVTELAAYRVVFSGNATGLAKADTKAALFSISGNSINSGKLVQTVSDVAATHKIRCLINGVVTYLMATTN